MSLLPPRFLLCVHARSEAATVQGALPAHITRALYITNCPQTRGFAGDPAWTGRTSPPLVVSKCALAAFLDCVADFPVSTQYAAAIVLTSSEMVLFQLVAFMSLISCVFSCYIYLSSFPWHLIFADHERVLSRIARFL